MDKVEKYLTERDVSKITQFALPTLRNWRHQRVGIPFLKVGRSVRYRESDVFAWLDKHLVAPDGGRG
jgi:predicted DNA-binding transcriptional regulator AlpA